MLLQVLVTVLDSKLKSRVSRMFDERKVKKEYLALVHGVPAEHEVFS